MADPAAGLAEGRRRAVIGPARGRREGPESDWSRAGDGTSERCDGGPAAGLAEDRRRGGDQAGARPSARPRIELLSDRTPDLRALWSRARNRARLMIDDERRSDWRENRRRKR